MRTLVEVFDQATLHDHTNGDHHRNGKQDGERYGPVNDRVAGAFAEDVIDVGNIDLQGFAQKVGSGFVDDSVAECQDAVQRHGAECTDHEERAVGEVNNAKCAEDQRQTQCDQRIC